MTIEIINIGTYPGDGTGDPIRTAFQKINDNFVQFAPVSFSGQYNSLFGIPSFATVATTGQYTSLLGLPPLGSLSILSSINNSNWLGTPLSVNNGGTGQTTSIAAFNVLSPINVSGDIIFGNSSGQSARLPIGSNTNILTVVNNSPQWAPTIGPAGYNTQIQFNNNGLFGAATALSYNSTGSYLTITPLVANGVPLNIRGVSGQTADLLDFTANGGSQGGLAKFTADGSLYIQGSVGSTTSIELSNKNIKAEQYQFKFANGVSGPYFKAFNSTRVGLYSSTGTPLTTFGLGDDAILYRILEGEIMFHNFMNSCRFHHHNWYYDDNNWESCDIDWKYETNVCRFGTDFAGTGVSRDLIFKTGGTDRCHIDSFGSMVHGMGLHDVHDIHGFNHFRMMPGPPLAIPTFFTGMCPHVINSVNFKVHYCINGVWYHHDLTPD